MIRSRRGVLLGVMLLCVGGMLAAPVQAVGNDNPRLKYLPKDYWLVAECDVGTLAKFMANANLEANPQSAQLMQALEMFKQYTAIDLLKDVEQATLFLSGDPGEPKVLAVVQGSFKNATVANTLTTTLGDAISEKEHNRHKIYEMHEMSLAFPKASTILVGHEDLVRGALDQSAAPAAALPKELASVLDRTPTKSLLWAAVKPRTLLDQEHMAPLKAGDAALHQSLRKLDCLSVFFELSDDGLLLKALGYAAAPGEAGSVHQYLSNRKKNLLHGEGTNVLFTSLLILSELKTDGSFVEGSFRMTGQALKELWNTRVIVRPGTDKPEKSDK